MKKTSQSGIKRVLKRDGSLVEFDLKKIENAILKALLETKEDVAEKASRLAFLVYSELEHIANKYKTFVPSVEGIQDHVEEVLMKEGLLKTAKAYIIYRKEREAERVKKQSFIVPSDEMKRVVKESSTYFKNPYSEFIFYRTYSKWRSELGRRETWIETIDRFMDYMKSNLKDKITTAELKEVRQSILTMEVCPSMRLLWSAGDACKKTNVCAYNCSYIAPTKWRDLGEIMYILMCGAGLGFSVESDNVEQFPQIKKQTGVSKGIHVIDDSKEGWADAFIYGCETWSEGFDVSFDYSKIRPSGTPLKTMGGRASGPQPLIDLMEFTKSKMISRSGKRLRTIDLHDIICKIGLIVVAGGVRRSALISLSELHDVDMQNAKQGQFYMTEGQRSMANNSTVYESRPSMTEFLDEWTRLVKSMSGERGVFNRGGLEFQVPKRRVESVKNNKQMGLNPCGEIVLRSKQFCNLTSIVVRPHDTKADLERKMKVATLIGTYQATLTNFGYLSKEWKKNCDEEALLGVSITGYYDNKIIRNDSVLQTLRDIGVQTNKKYAKRFEINESAAITCVKPHGNSGQLLGVGSGMHPWFSQYFIRRVRIGTNDPLLKVMIDAGVPAHPEIGYSTANSTVMVLEFPVAAPKGAITKESVSAIDLLHEWKRLKVNFTEHNPSATIYVGEDEWISTANFVYENWDIVGGLSFLPRFDHVYQLAPYEEITKEEYEKRKKEIKNLDFAQLFVLESEDNTEGAKELACVSGDCEV